MAVSELGSGQEPKRIQQCEMAGVAEAPAANPERRLDGEIADWLSKTADQNDDVHDQC